MGKDPVVLEAEFQQSEPETKAGGGGRGGGRGMGVVMQHIEDGGAGGDLPGSSLGVTVAPEAGAGTMEAGVPSSPI